MNVSARIQRLHTLWSTLCIIRSSSTVVKQRVLLSNKVHLMRGLFVINTELSILINCLLMLYRQ